MCSLCLPQVTGSTSGATLHQAAGDSPFLFRGLKKKMRLSPADKQAMCKSASWPPAAHLALCFQLPAKKKKVPLALAFAVRFFQRAVLTKQKRKQQDVSALLISCNV